MFFSYTCLDTYINNLTPQYRPGADGVKKSQSIISAAEDPEIGSKRSLANLQTGTIHILHCI